MIITKDYDSLIKRRFGVCYSINGNNFNVGFLFGMSSKRGLDSGYNNS
jgi:hypothetical protein